MMIGIPGRFNYASPALSGEIFTTRIARYPERMLGQADEPGGIDGALGWALLVVVAAAFGLVVWRVDRWFSTRPRSLVRPVGMLALTLAGLLALVLAAPVSDETRGDLIGLYGLALTAVIALASTTFVSNAMAGLMLRSLRNFAPGDFIKVGEDFGRVTERGLFHTEIQTEDSDLTTIPNLRLATTPTTVVRASGTIISATVSLGYDAPRGEVEAALLAAADHAGLREPFVQVMELGDFSVTYRFAGFLDEVKHLVSSRSRLRASAMDALHAAGIEIVSPTFTNRRPIGPEPVAPAAGGGAGAGASGGGAEKVMFDKAEEAATLAGLEEELASVRAGLRDGAGDEADRLKREAERLEAAVERRREQAEAEKPGEPEAGGR